MSSLVREAYDAVAGEYARLLPDLCAEAPLDRAVLSAFVAMVAGGDRPVVEVGCGSGRITAHLSAAGLRMTGLDLSPVMIRQARAAQPHLPFAVGDLRALPVRAGSLAGVVSWYSVIHLPPDELPRACAELARVAQIGAPVLVAFQGGAGERVDRTSSYGLPVALTYYRHRVDQVVDLLVGGGFSLHATSVREPWLPHETTPQAFVLAVRQDAAGSAPSQR